MYICNPFPLQMPCALLLKRCLASDGYFCALCATCLLYGCKYTKLGANTVQKWYKIKIN